MRRLIWISTVCKFVSEFTWCPKFHDFTQVGKESKPLQTHYERNERTICFSRPTLSLYYSLPGSHCIQHDHTRFLLRVNDARTRYKKFLSCSRNVKEDRITRLSCFLRVQYYYMCCSNSFNLENLMCQKTTTTKPPKAKGASSKIWTPSIPSPSSSLYHPKGDQAEFKGKQVAIPSCQPRVTVT